MNETVIELLQFPFSHYNEKVRWGLDLKRVPHRRRDLLPGPHALVVRRLTGQTKTPVLLVGGEAFHGSARILDLLEERYPDPSLLPHDKELERQARDLQHHFDEEVGPKVRRALFALLLPESRYLAKVFGSGRAGPARALFRASLPLLRIPMARDMGIRGDESVELALQGTIDALELVARETAATGYLVGNRFTVADLTAAALLAPTVMPEESPMCLPEPRPKSVEGWLAAFAGHPGAAWVERMYRRHRRPAAAMATP